MPVVACPECASQLNAPESALGRQVKCPKCGTTFTLSAPSSSAGVRSSKPGSAPAAPNLPKEPPPREEDDSTRRARRRRERDDDFDDEDYERPPLRRRRHSRGDTGNTGLQMGLGVAALCVGIVGLIFAFIPCIGLFSLPLSIIGFILGLVGLVVAIVRKEGLGFPIAGTAVNAAGLVVVVIWFFVVASWFQSTSNAMRGVQQEMIAAQQRQMAMQGIGPRGPVVMQVDGVLNNGDARDRVRLGSPCKVYSVTLAAGKTYWIDMISPGNQIDSYLRLEDATAQQLAQDDDSGGFPSARIIYACPRAGAYRVVATTFGGGTGGFNLKVQEQ